MSIFGLVLGGGGARGFAHIGVAKVLQREGLRPQLIAGTSMGGLIGAFLAAGHTPEDMLGIARSVPWRNLLDLRPGTGLLRGASLEHWLGRYLPATFEELPTPLIVTATDVLSGRAVYLRSGPLLPALRATTAYPGAIDPVPMNGLLLADGGVLNQVPVDAALFLGATRVLAVDVTAPAPLEVPQRRLFLSRQREAHLGSVAALRRAVDIMQAQLTDARLSLYRADVLLQPTLTGIELSSFGRALEAAARGEQAVQAQLPRLHALFGVGRASDGHAMLPEA